MASTYTTNKSIEQPGNNDYVNTWNVPVNADFAIIDKAFGGTTILTDTSGTLTLTAEQYQALSMTSTATLSGNITYRLPSGVGGQWIIDNRTSGSYTFTVSSLGGGTSVVCPQSARTLIYSDGTNVRLSTDTSVTAGTGIAVAGSTVSLSVPVTAVRGGTGFTTYTTGDIIYASASNTLSKLAAGTAGYVLTMSGGVPTWAAAPGGSGGTGTVTSITVTGGTTGLTFTPTTPITTSGTFSMQGTLAVTNGGTGGYDQASARAGIGLGTIAIQSSSAVNITGGSISGVTLSSATITGGTASNLTTARVGTSSALSSAETVSVLAPASTDGVVSKVTTNTNFNFVGQNSSGTETFTVDGTGDVFAGTTAAFTGAKASFTNDVEWAVEAYHSASGDIASGAMAVRVNNQANSLIEFFNNSTSVAGSITASGASVAYNTSSDYRLKDNVSDLSSGISKVKSLRPVNFTWKQYPSAPSVNGFIAHEVQAVIPQAVNGSKDAVNPDGSMRIQGIDHSMLVPVLTAAIKELIARVEELEAKLA